MTSEAQRRIDHVLRTGARTLDLGGLELTEVPDALRELFHLGELDLSGNGLSSLPESLGDLTSLTRLFLNLNRLTTLPESLGDLTSLTVLDLTGNRLTALPESMAHLTSLTELDLRRNPITRLPDWLRELPNLTLLKLSPDFPDPPDWARRLAYGAGGAQAPRPAPNAGHQPHRVTPPTRAERPLAGRHFIVGIRPVRLRGLDTGGLACEAFDWSTGGFVMDNSYLSKVISGYGEVDEVSAREFDAAVERLCIDRGFMARHEPGVLQRVGFFREMPHGAPTDPSLQAARGETVLPDEEEIASYLAHGQVHIATPGSGHDVFDPTRRIDPPHYLTDGRFVWPGDLAYYVRNYHVRLPEPFVAHMAAAGWSIPTDIDVTALRLP